MNASRPLNDTHFPARFRHAAMATAVLAVFGSPALALAQVAPAGSASAVGTEMPAISGGVAMSYTGGLSQLGIGIDKDSRIRGQASHVLNEDALSAWIAQGWLGGGSGGVRIDYNWIAGENDKPAVDGMVRKLFAAVDRNRDADSKLTIGFGLERENWFGSISYAQGLSDRRWIGPATITEVSREQTGTESGRPYIDTLVTSTSTRFFERAYEHGVGVRTGYLYPEALIRVSVGADREWGEFSARQSTVSLGLEKFFSGSPHSLGLSLEKYRKSGEYESQGDGSRVQLTYRFSLGGSPAASSAGWRETIATRQVQTPAATEPGAEQRQSLAPIVQTKTELRIVKTTATMTGDAFFELNSAQLTPSAKVDLDRVATILKTTERAGNIKIAGHTCDLGSDAYNMKLSQRRASSVRDYLSAQSMLPLDVFVTEGKGESEPKYPNTRESRSKNRRVDLDFIQYRDKTEEVQVPIEVKTQSPGIPTAVQWKTEVIDQEPAWVRRALRNTIPHKQTVDTYRGAEITQATTSSRAYVNRVPVAVDDSVTLATGVATSISVLSNDSDPDGNKLSIASVTVPSHGTAVISGNTITYTPTSGFSGVDSFSYTIDDGAGGRASAKVIANIMNSAPLAKDDAVTVSSGVATNISVLANDSDPDGNPLTIVAVSSPAHGTATISGSSILYTPTNGYIGIDSFSYTVDDGAGGRSSAQVTATVQRSNRSPQANNDRYVVGSSGIWPMNVLANDSDPDGDPIAIASFTQPSTGVVTQVGNSLSFQSAGSFAYTTFTYTINDGYGGTSTATVTVVDP